MHKVLMVIRREYLERVRKKSFWIGTLIFPLLMVGLIFGQIGLAALDTGEQRRIAFLDQTREVLPATTAKLSEYKLRDGSPQYLVEEAAVEGSLDEARRPYEARVASGELFGVVTVGTSLEAKENFRFYARNVGNPEVTRALEEAIEDAVVELRFRRENLNVDRKTLDRLTAPIDLETFQVAQEGGVRKKDFLQAYLGTFTFVMVLYMSLLLYGIAVMRGILEEKSNRVMEVLLGPLRPGELMTGKIVGIGLVGLTQMAVYVVAAAVFRVYVGTQSATGGLAMFAEAFSVGKLIYFVLYFLLGYFLYVGLFAAIGAVCNTEQEAQNLQSGVTMCLVVPMIATFFFVKNPDSIYSVVASLIPLFTPMVMFMRISVLPPPFWQIALSVGLLLVSIWIVFRGVAKVFRIGILMYGKRPTVPEILRWARS